MSIRTLFNLEIERPIEPVVNYGTNAKREEALLTEVLVVLDGLRPDAISREGMPNLHGILRGGWQAADAGSRLNPPTTQEGTAWIASLAAVLRKTRRTE